jgi:hypothetical protein
MNFSLDLLSKFNRETWKTAYFEERVGWIRIGKMAFNKIN